MPRPVPPAVLAMLLAVAGCAVAGCGGDGRLSAKELRARASAICTRTAEAMDRVAMPNDPSQGGRFLRRGLLRMQPGLDELAALKPPQDLQASYARALKLGRHELATIASKERAIRGGDDVISTFRALQTALAPITQAEDLAWQGLQIPACVKR